MKHNTYRKFFVFLLSCILLAGCSSQTEQIPETANVDEEVAVERQSIYSDIQNGISYILPAGWNVSAVDHTHESMRFTVDAGGAPFMKYTCRDYWSELSKVSDENISRRDMNNDLLLSGKADELFEFDIEDAEQVEYDDNVFFRVELADSSNPSVVWYRMENGWVDMFEFEADEENLFYSDFEALVSSVVYDRVIPEEEMVMPVQEEDTGILLEGKWSEDKFSRNGRSSPYFIFDEPLKKCKGFSLIYSVSDVTDGKMKSDSKFQLYYGLADGSWVKGEEFMLDDEGVAIVEQKLNKAATVTKVAVHCLNAGYFNFTYIFGIFDAVY